MVDRDKFVRYAQIKQDIALLETEADEMKPEILAELRTVENEKPVELENVGVFCIVKRKNWKYSSAVTSLENQLKQAKKDEEALGTAECTISETVMFKTKNPQGNEGL
jgi:hypothetical protein